MHARSVMPVTGGSRAQLRAEISALAGNSHPNILQLYNAFFDERSGLVCVYFHPDRFLRLTLLSATLRVN